MDNPHGPNAGAPEAPTCARSKQQHTARRVLARLADEHAVVDVSYASVRDYVARRRPQIQAEVGRLTEQAFVPQTHAPGEQAEVDFGDVWLTLAGEKVRCFMFTYRLSFSGAAVHRVYASQGQEAFIEGHLEAFRVLGVPTVHIRYDNLKSAVTRVLFGRTRTESDRWTLFRSHAGFDAFYCMPGIEGAHEKGGVEGEVGRFRRNHLVPQPDVATLGELNARLELADQTDLARRIENRTRTVGSDLALERPLLRALPADGFDPGLSLTPRVDRYARVMVRQCQYSVPARLIGRRVRVSLRASEVVVFDGRTEVARHARSVRKGSTVLLLDHYLEVLARKPGALPGATALAQAALPAPSPARTTRSGRWPASTPETLAAAGCWWRRCCCTVTSRTSTSSPDWSPRCRSDRPAPTWSRSRLAKLRAPEARRPRSRLR
jgi:hypothetical protein